jgi:hypothetical protein
MGRRIVDDVTMVIERGGTMMMMIVKGAVRNANNDIGMMMTTEKDVADTEMTIMIVIKGKSITTERMTV